MGIDIQRDILGLKGQCVNQIKLDEEEGQLVIGCRRDRRRKAIEELKENRAFLCLSACWDAVFDGTFRPCSQWPLACELKKGSHGMLYYGDKKTTVRNLKDELKTGTFKAMLKQLGISEAEL